MPCLLSCWRKKLGKGPAALGSVESYFIMPAMQGDMVAGRPVSARRLEQCIAGDWLRNCDTPPGSGDWTSELVCPRVESGASVGIAALLCASTAQKPQ